MSFLLHQKTIAQEMTLSGKTLFSGKESRLSIQPAEENFGIHFIRRDLPGAPSLRANAEAIHDPQGPFRCTTLSHDNFMVYPVEHLMASFHGLGVTNAVITLDQEELPFFDGSARFFTEEILKSRIRNQNARVPEMILEKEIRIEHQDQEIQLLPSKDLRIEYHLEHPHPSIGSQFYAFDFSEEAFLEKIAPARTFCTDSEARNFLNKGGKGGGFENCLVFGEVGLQAGHQRFPEEPARHKILDLMGDLFLLGKQIRARIIAKKSGHRLNVRAVKELSRKVSP